MTVVLSTFLFKNECPTRTLVAPFPITPAIADLGQILLYDMGIVDRAGTHRNLRPVATNERYRLRCGLRHNMRNIYSSLTQRKLICEVELSGVLELRAATL